MSGSRDFGAQLFTCLLRSLGVETRLVYSLQPLGFSFGKQEDAHRLDKKKDDFTKDINASTPTKNEPDAKKGKKRKVEEESDDEDLGLPKVKGKGMSVGEGG